MWWDGIRELTEEECQLIHDYMVERFCGDHGEEWLSTAEYYYKKVMDDKCLKMDFLEFAQKGTDMDPCAIQQYVLTD